jgi:hypothetical protein
VLSSVEDVRWWIVLSVSRARAEAENSIRPERRASGVPSQSECTQIRETRVEAVSRPAGLKAEEEEMRLILRRGGLP